MPKSKHSEAAMIAALQQLEAGRKAANVAREVGVSPYTIYAWKAKYGSMSVSEAQEQICEQIAQLLAPIQATRVNRGGGGSDIEPIGSKSVPTLSPSTTGEHYFDWHHTQADTLDKVNPDDFRKNIAVLAVLAYVLADMPGRLAGSTSP